jgi:hypothetical protein
MYLPTASSRTSFWVDARLELEVEVVERLHAREVGDLDAHGDALALLRADLLLEQRVEEVEVGRLGVSRGGEQRIELIGEAPEAKPAEVIQHAGARDLGAHAAPPTTAA